MQLGSADREIKINLSWLKTVVMLKKYLLSFGLLHGLWPIVLMAIEKVSRWEERQLGLDSSKA